MSKERLGSYHLYEDGEQLIIRASGLFPGLISMFLGLGVLIYTLIASGRNPGGVTGFLLFLGGLFAFVGAGALFTRKMWRVHKDGVSAEHRWLFQTSQRYVPAPVTIALKETSYRKQIYYEAVFIQDDMDEKWEFSFYHESNRSRLLERMEQWVELHIVASEK